MPGILFFLKPKPMTLLKHETHNYFLDIQPLFTNLIITWIIHRLYLNHNLCYYALFAHLRHNLNISTFVFEFTSKVQGKVVVRYVSYF
jgi:hypothetical protein